MGERCELHEVTMEQFKSFQQNQIEIVKGLHEVRERVVIMEQSMESVKHRLDAQEEQTKAIYELAYEVKAFGQKQEQILAQQGEMLSLMKEHDGRLDKLERAPGDNILSYWKIFVGAIIAGAGGYIFAIWTTKGTP